MLKNFTLPTLWANPDGETIGHAHPKLDTGDRSTNMLLHAIAELNDKERGLALVMVQSIAAWGGLKSAA